MNNDNMLSIKIKTIAAFNHHGVVGDVLTPDIGALATAALVFKRNVMINTLGFQSIQFAKKIFSLYVDLLCLIIRKSQPLTHTFASVNPQRVLFHTEVRPQIGPGESFEENEMGLWFVVGFYHLIVMQKEVERMVYPFSKPLESHLALTSCALQSSASLSFLVSSSMESLSSTTSLTSFPWGSSSHA